jgi:hypothetical protein
MFIPDHAPGFLQQWNNGAYCGKSITISYQGQTTHAKIMDQVGSLVRICFFSLIESSSAWDVLQVLLISP